MLVDWEGYTPGSDSRIFEEFQALRSTAQHYGSAALLAGSGRSPVRTLTKAFTYGAFERHGFAVTPVFDVTRLLELVQSETAGAPVLRFTIT